MIYDISFDRIGRRRDVPPLEVTVKAADEWRAGDVVAEKVYRYAGKYLASRGYEVDVDLEKGTGYIFTGQPAGDFTVTAREPAHVLSEPRQIQYPGGKDGFWVVDCSCGYATGPTSLSEHATLRAENHQTAKEETPR